MPIKRKKASYLNTLRMDVDTALGEIGQIGADIDAAAFDLSRVLACDIKSDTTAVKIMFDALFGAHEEMGKSLNAFRIARNKYLEFF